MSIVSIDGTPLVGIPERKLDPRLNHLGQFSIPRSVVQDKFDEIMRFMKDIMIVRAELLYTANNIVYTGISTKYFRFVGPSENVPAYDFHLLSDGTIVATEKV